MVCINKLMALGELKPMHKWLNEHFKQMQK